MKSLKKTNRYQKQIIGTRIKKRREKLGLDSKQIAKTIQVTWREYKEIEAGSLPTIDITIFHMLAEALDVTPNWLYHGKNKVIIPQVEHEKISAKLRESIEAVIKTPHYWLKVDILNHVKIMLIGSEYSDFELFNQPSFVDDDPDTDK